MTQIENLQATIDGLNADRARLDRLIALLIQFNSASVEVIRAALPIIADANPPIAAKANEAVRLWTEFVAGADLARAADELQNAPTSDITN
jgi:hypothetical protein